MSRRDWIAVAVLAVGLAAFVFSLSPGGGDPSGVRGSTWALGLGIVLALAAVLAAVGWRSGRDLRAGLLGVAAGVGYGAAAVLFSVAGDAASQGVGILLTTWQAYGAIATALASFYVLQNSLSAGLLVATEPGLTVANPLVAVTWGLLVFGEQGRGGPWLVGSVAGGVLLLVGVILLARSPVLTAGRPERTVRARDAQGAGDPSASGVSGRGDGRAAGSG